MVVGFQVAASLLPGYSTRVLLCPAWSQQYTPQLRAGHQYNIMLLCYIDAILCYVMLCYVWSRVEMARVVASWEKVRCNRVA
jgi:hypothetical protein